ncbi:MAG TPA: hypothetical protein VNK89_08475 [Thermoflexus sp.]|nr:hypothetical protein [Thermoflexus sp.]
MKRWKIWIGLGILAGLLGLGLLGVGMVRMGIAQADSRLLAVTPTPGPGVGIWGRGWMGPMGPMMGRGVASPPTAVPRFPGGMGPMMGGWGWGPFASRPPTSTLPFGGCPMIGGSWGSSAGPTARAPISDEEAVRIAREAIAAYGNPDLELAEVMAFDNHFYAQARERSTGRYAFELLIDRYTGAVHPEPGPNMMWNARYGMMGWGMGMMGGWFSPSGEMSLSPEEARQRAQAYLDQAMPGAVVDEEVDPFYGYYTLHILRDGQIVGMLSVHGSTGQVWVHTWHGNFLRMVYGREEGHE